MKTNLLSLLLLSSLVFICAPSAQAQEESEWPTLDVSPLDMASYPARAAFRNYLGEEGKTMSVKVRVMYSRPKMNGRTIFGELIPFGSVWRLGANEATEIMFAQPVDIGGTTVPQGFYTIHADVNKEDWTIHFSTQRSIWGSANRDKEQDIASLKVPVKQLDQSLENFSITFQRVDDDNANMVMAWENTEVSVPIGFNPVIYSGVDASPMDLIQFPNQSRFHNYLKPEELEGMGTRVRVTYSRPQKKGRDIFGQLLPFGSVWRVGANESSEISFYEKVSLGGEEAEINPGRYALYAEVNEGSWDIILSSDLPAWGSANRDESKDVARVRVTTAQDDEVVEALSMRFQEKGEGAVDLIIAWDTTRATLPIKFSN
ncbi:MAG: DUF2911 domain-containing protein [Saprospiraceae bacterium]|nr:DUF2911 domain-containing protein [Saprospiraceae bacterium]